MSFKKPPREIPGASLEGIFQDKLPTRETPKEIGNLRETSTEIPRETLRSFAGEILDESSR